jgi:hypothetical protein
MAAFEKQKAAWNSESILPDQVENQRRELPKVDEQMAAAPAAASAASGSGAISAGNIARSDNAGVRRTRRPVRSIYTSDKVKGQGIPDRATRTPL